MRKKHSWMSSAGCVYNIGYHVVWSTKYRKQVLKGEVESSLKGIFRDLEKQNGFRIQEMEVMPDHCHLFITCHPKTAPSNIVKILKPAAKWVHELLHLDERKHQLLDYHDLSELFKVSIRTVHGFCTKACARGEYYKHDNNVVRKRFHVKELKRAALEYLKKH